MKLIIYIIVFAFSSCSLIGTDEKPKKEVAYDVEKDKMINRLLDTKPLSHSVFHRDSFEVWYEIYWPELKMGIKHLKTKEYSHPDGWEFGAIAKDGTMVILESNIGIQKHNIAPATYERIKMYCISLDSTKQQ